MPFIAHAAIRNRGTIGGSLAHADPAAELPAVMVALDAQFELRTQTQSRTVGAQDFFWGLFSTVLEPTELLTEIQIPKLPAEQAMLFRRFRGGTETSRLPVLPPRSRSMRRDNAREPASRCSASAIARCWHRTRRAF